MVHSYCMLGNQAATVSDGASDTFTQIINTARTSIWYTFVKSPTNTITVTYTNCSFSSSSAGTFSAEEFSGVASIGNSASQAACPNSGGCTDSISLAIGTNNAAVYEAWDVNGPTSAPCPTFTNGASEITTQTLLCDNGLGSDWSLGRTLYNLNRGIGTNSFSMTTSNNAAGSGTRHAVVELDPPGGTPSNLGTQTACYGNCGNPAVTLANTNSTHTVAFNQSITLLYTFQSQLNGQVLNVTTNVAKNYINGQTVTVGIYTVATCPPGTPAFSTPCPGTLQAMISIRNPGKGVQSLPNQSVPVSAGQWVGIGLTGTFTGLDINDTNTQVGMAQVAGAMPPTISQTTTFSAVSKVGLWAYIVGNTITGPNLPPQGPTCTNNWAQLDCLIPALSNGMCFVVTASCQTSGSLFWIIILTVLSFLVVTIGFASAHVTKFVAAGDVFLFFFLAWFFIFVGVGVIQSFVVIFFLFIGATVFGKTARNYF